MVESLSIAMAPGAPATGLANLVDGLAVLLLLIALAGLATHRLERGVWLIGAQGIVLATVAASIAAGTGAWHVYAAALLTLAVKVLAIPLVLLRVLQSVRQRREIAPLLSTKLVLLLAIGLVLVAYRAAGELALPGAVPTHQALPVSLALILLGLLLMLVRGKALFQVLGVITMENGVYLAALVATHGLPLAIELGVFFDLLVGVLLMGVLVTRISDSFDSTNIDRLRSLRH
jgi:hydrogenase-4 membrane subunit HyfE